MRDFNFIVDRSGDSMLEEYFYSNRILTLVLNMSQFDKKVTFKIETDCLAFSIPHLDPVQDIHRTCRIEILDLLSSIELENGIYVPPRSFSKFMSDSRASYNLAYGKKATQIKYIFSLVGYERLVSCTVSDLSQIKVENFNWDTAK